MIFYGPHSFIDHDRALFLGAAYLQMIWKEDVSKNNNTARRVGDVWVVERGFPKGFNPKPYEDFIFEPWVVLIKAEDGSLCGGSLVGYPDALKKLGHRIERAQTLGGTDVTSLLGDHRWEDIVASAKRTQRHRAFPFLKIHELLGGDAEVNTDGTLTINHERLKPAAKYRNYLKGLASLDRQTHFPPKTPS